LAKLPEDPGQIERMITYLVDQKFGVNGPGIVLSAERIARKDGTKAAEMANYVKELRELTQEELKNLYDTAVQKRMAQNKERAEAEEAARFFNQPHARADFDHWSKAAYWSLDEAVALSFGKAPEHVNWKKIESYTQISALARDYARRRDLAHRAVGMKQLTDGVLPGFFLGWAKRNELDVPEDLVRLVEKRGQLIADWPALLKACQDKQAETIEWAKQYHEKALEIGKAAADKAMAGADARVEQYRQINTELNRQLAELRTVVASPVAVEETLNPKSRQSLLKLVLGMAIDAYGYDPKSKKSPIPKQVVDNLAEHGISIDEDTARSWLREAAETVTHTSTIGTSDS
jgi:hypothetical protein